jgi:Tol biopolymer transport system component
LIGSPRGAELWLLNTSGGPPRRLPYPPGQAGGAVWSHDGGEIAFLLDDGKAGGAALMRQTLNSVAVTESLLKSPHFLGVTDWSSDGRFLIVQFEDAKSISHISMVSTVGDRRPIGLVDTGSLDGQGQLSSDAKWLAYRSRQSGRDEIYVKRVGSDDPPWQISTNGGNSPRWRRDGHELFYLQHDRSLMAVEIERGATNELQAWTPKKMFDVHARMCGCFNFVPSPDGQRFLVNAFPSSGESQPLVLVQNWAASFEPSER